VWRALVPECILPPVCFPAPALARACVRGSTRSTRPLSAGGDCCRTGDQEALLRDAHARQPPRPAPAAVLHERATRDAAAQRRAARAVPGLVGAGGRLRGVQPHAGRPPSPLRAGGWPTVAAQVAPRQAVGVGRRGAQRRQFVRQAGEHAERRSRADPRSRARGRRGRAAGSASAGRQQRQHGRAGARGVGRAPRRAGLGAARAQRADERGGRGRRVAAGAQAAGERARSGAGLAEPVQPCARPGSRGQGACRRARLALLGLPSRPLSYMRRALSCMLAGTAMRVTDELRKGVICVPARPLPGREARVLL